VDFDELFRALNEVGYTGPLSVEWEDAGMDREFGAAEAVEFVRRADFVPSELVFDAAMQRNDASVIRVPGGPTICAARKPCSITHTFAR
jgi:hypothetical protein